MEYKFDLNETQQNILEKCPEWNELMNVIEFKNTPWADPTGYGDKTVYYNGRSITENEIFLPIHVDEVDNSNGLYK